MPYLWLIKVFLSDLTLGNLNCAVSVILRCFYLNNSARTHFKDSYWYDAILFIPHLCHTNFFCDDRFSCHEESSVFPILLPVIFFIPMCCAEQFHDYLWLSQTCETSSSHGVQAYLDMYLRPTHNLKCCLFVVIMRIAL